MLLKRRLKCEVKICARTVSSPMIRVARMTHFINHVRRTWSILFISYGLIDPCRDFAEAVDQAKELAARRTMW